MDKKIVMVKLIIQKKNCCSNNKMFSLLGKSSGLIPLVSNSFGVLDFVGKGCCLSCQMARGFFFFSTFFGLIGYLLQVGALKWSHEVTSL
jgi:hypothetical protein